MNIEEIPSDEIMAMTEKWHRAFKAAGCAPMCHCCVKELLPESKFKLATVDTHSNKSANSGISTWGTTETREVMLCDMCTVEILNNRTKMEREKYEEYMATTSGGCYRVNGKIVH